MDTPRELSPEAQLMEAIQRACLDVVIGHDEWWTLAQASPYWPHGNDTQYGMKFIFAKMDDPNARQVEVDITTYKRPDKQ